MSKFNHSIKVPTQYKRTAAVLRDALEHKKSLKYLIFEEKHARVPTLQKLLELYAKNREAINEAIEKTQILKDNPRLCQYLCRVLVAELIYGRRTLNGESKPVQTVKNYKERLLEVINGVKIIETEDTTKEAVSKHFRYVRVNTNLISLTEVFNYLETKGFKKKELPVFENYNDFLQTVSNLDENEYMMDMHLDDLLIFHSKTKQYWARNQYVHEKKLILQNKAPSLAVELLSPPPGSILLDMCAAPGIKTILACNRMNNNGKIYAVELNRQRFNVLQEMTKKAGCTIVETINADSLMIDDSRCPDVEYVVIDPPCSGSGMKRLSLENEEKDPTRLRRLGYLQFRMLSHAMTAFPKVKKIVYSTCSLYEEENEQVIQECLEKNSNFKLLSCKKALRNKWNSFGDSKYENIGKKCMYARPTEDLTDGIFIALFERNNDSHL